MALKDVPQSFSIDSEEEVRFAIASFFKDLGFDLDEFSFEDHFSIQLGHTHFTADNVYRKNATVNKDAHGYSDLLLTYSSVPLAVVEVKRQDHFLNDNDAWQAISYARLLRRQIAPFAIVTNGIETKVYDTLADTDQLVELSLPNHSKWHANDKSVTINEDLKAYAARKLVGINPNTLHKFCQEQLQSSLKDLKGSIQEFMPYVPTLYLAREKVNTVFSQWLDSDLPCFAVVGESGSGKTNFMCATAEEHAKHDFVLFYSAMNLPPNGVVQAIADDFTWEFRRELNIAQIIERFNYLVTKHKKKLFIFIDGLDEFTGDLANLRSELINLIHRLSGTSVRLCISCKGYNWESFVITPDGSYNRLARLIFPPIQVPNNASMLRPPNANKVGYWIENFEDHELDQAFVLYKELFSLTGKLEGKTRIVCQIPLMLRLIAEVYFGSTTDLPSDISTKELLDKYWLRKLGKVSNRTSAELLLSVAAQCMVEYGEQTIHIQLLTQERVWSTTVYEDLLRQGILKLSGHQHITFHLNQLRNYVYTVRSQGWNELPSVEVVRQIQSLLLNANSLRLEAVDFYFSTIDRGMTDLLTKLAVVDPMFFAQLINLEHLPPTLKSPLWHLPEHERLQAFRNRLDQYAQAYVSIVESHFSNIARWFIQPKGNVTVTVGNGHSIIYSVTTPRQYTRGEFRSPIQVDTAFADKLRRYMVDGVPIENILEDLGLWLPQIVAWKQIITQVQILYKKRSLSESSSPYILHERICGALFQEPRTWYPECPDRLHNHEKLNFKHSDNVYLTEIIDLVHSVETLMNGYIEIIRSQHQHDTYRKWCDQQIEQLYVLHYRLKNLMKFRSVLGSPAFELKDMFSCIRNSEKAVPLLQKLLPEILASYRSLLRENFPTLAQHFALFKYESAALLVEITHDPDQSPFTSDYLEIRYILLPSQELPEKYIVYSRQRKESFAHISLRQDSLRSKKEIHLGGNFGRTSVSCEINGYIIDEPNAYVYCTDFPDMYAITEQAYQLMAAETAYLFQWDRLAHILRT